MDKHRVESYRKRLLREREDLLNLAQRARKDGRFAEEEGTQDLADKAANSYTKEFLFYQSSNERTRLQLIEEALSRIEEGSYGECVQCGEPVESKRLEAVPWARNCVPCQQKQDEGLL
jgi:RNA polymerase-binding transcription factor